MYKKCKCGNADDYIKTGIARTCSDCYGTDKQNLKDTCWINACYQPKYKDRPLCRHHISKYDKSGVSYRDFFKKLFS